MTVEDFTSRKPRSTRISFLSLASRRLIRLIPVLVIITVILFVIYIFFADIYVGAFMGRISPVQLEQLYFSYGTNRPIYEQFIIFLQRVITLDFGDSYVNGKPVIGMLANYLPGTIELFLASLLFASVIGIPLGVISAFKQHSRTDYVISSAVFTLASIPVFFLASILIFLAFITDTGSIFGRIDFKLAGDFLHVTNFYIIDTLISGRIDCFISAVIHLILPALTLSVVFLPLMIRTTRSVLLDEVRKGKTFIASPGSDSKNTTAVSNFLRITIVAPFSVIGLNPAGLLAGIVVTETIFSWSGIGRWLFQTTMMQDTPAIFLLIVLIIVFITIVNTISDIVNSYLDRKWN